MSCLYQLKITLKDTKPAIWRRILIPGDMTFRDLHETIQVAMGWFECHLHQFFTEKQHGLYMGGCITDTQLPDDIEPFEDAAEERDVKLCDRLKEVGDRCGYEYDFGDGWQHEVLLEKISESEKSVEYPICIGGKRQCPPEDCGGTGGYYHLLEILADPKHKEHEDMLEWLGLENADEYDPEEFDVDVVNEVLRDL